MFQGSGLDDAILSHHQVVSGATLEVTTAQFWSSAGDSSLEQELEFHGVAAEPASAFIDGSAARLVLGPCFMLLIAGGTPPPPPLLEIFRVTAAPASAFMAALQLRAVLDAFAKKRLLDCASMRDGLIELQLPMPLRPEGARSAG